MSDEMQKENLVIEEEKLNDQMKVRREKMQSFIDAGVYPFGQKFDWDHHAQELKDQAEALEKDETVVRIAGRLMAIRRHGKTAFCVLRDISGEIQLDSLIADIHELDPGKMLPAEPRTPETYPARTVYDSELLPLQGRD